MLAIPLTLSFLALPLFLLAVPVDSRALFVQRPSTDNDRASCVYDTCSKVDTAGRRLIASHIRAGTLACTYVDAVGHTTGCAYDQDTGLPSDDGDEVAGTCPEAVPRTCTPHGYLREDNFTAAKRRREVKARGEGTSAAERRGSEEWRPTFMHLRADMANQKRNSADGYSSYIAWRLGMESD